MPSLNVAQKILTFSEKIKLGISCELSAKQTIHMKCQTLFRLKKKEREEKKKREREKKTLCNAFVFEA